MKHWNTKGGRSLGAEFSFGGKKFLEDEEIILELGSRGIESISINSYEK
jgi:hypothetical protein